MSIIEVAYGLGVRAAWRIEEYEKFTDVPDNPYTKGSPEADAWYDGFGDGTEDLIFFNTNG